MSNHLLDIRSYVITVTEKVVEVIHTTIKKCYPDFYSEQVIDFFLDYHSEQHLKERVDRGEFYLLYLHDKLIGTGFLDEEEIGGLYILPDFQNKGYGTFMLNFLLDRARKKGLKKVWLDATPNSKALYARLGFSHTEEKIMYVDEKYPLVYYYMEYSLST